MTKTCTNTGLTGGRFCTTGNPMGVPTGIYPAKDSQSFTAAEFLLKTAFAEAIKKEQIFPIHGDMFKGFEDNSAETRMHEWPNQTRSVMQQKVPRFTVILDLNECQKRQLAAFRGFKGRIYFEYGNFIRGMSDDAKTTIKGALISMMNIESGDFNTADGTKGNIKLIFDLADESDFFTKEHAIEMDWDTRTLDGLTEVDLVQVGTPTATGLKIQVGAVCYGKLLPIGGLIADDFTITGGGSITSVTEANGEYTFVTVGIANDSVIDLVAPSAISESDYFIKSSGGLVVSGIV